MALSHFFCGKYPLCFPEIAHCCLCILFTNAYAELELLCRVSLHLTCNLATLNCSVPAMKLTINCNFVPTTVLRGRILTKISCALPSKSSLWTEIYIHLKFPKQTCAVYLSLSVTQVWFVEIFLHELKVFPQCLASCCNQLTM